MNPLLAYTLARLGVFVVSYGLTWAVAQFWLEWSAVTNLWVMLIALAISAAVSIFALSGLRNRVAQRIQERAERLSQRLEESRSAE
ncbi:MAG: DUF4229 domain-containing protein, partial [Propionibacteriales bacterium]|nr:DUF4229 domain-containing protein [Propionibacteriales bacterium]